MPDAAVSSMRASCSAGRRRSLASRNSPDVSSGDIPLLPPTNTIATSAPAGRPRRRTARRGRRAGVGTARAIRRRSVGGTTSVDDLIGGDVDGAPGIGVVAVEPAGVGRRRAEHRHRASRPQRQDPVVGQHHDRAGRGPAGQSQILSRLDLLRRTAQGSVLEEPERRLLLEDPTAGPLDDRFVQQPGPTWSGRVGSTPRTAARRRPGHQRQTGRLLPVGGDVVEPVEVVHREVVGDDASPEAQLPRGAGR